MANLDHLKIKKAPKAFAGWARNFNQQVDLLASIQGGPGVQADVAHSPRKVQRGPAGSNPKEQPRGKIMISLRPSAINGIGVGGGTGGGNTTQAVGIEGLLLDVLQPTSTNAATTFPNVVRSGNGSTYTIANTTGFSVVNGGNSCSIPFSSITRPMTIRTLTVCDNGNTRSIDIIASASY